MRIWCISRQFPLDDNFINSHYLSVPLTFHSQDLKANSPNSNNTFLCFLFMRICCYIKTISLDDNLSACNRQCIKVVERIYILITPGSERVKLQFETRQNVQCLKKKSKILTKETAASVIRNELHEIPLRFEQRDLCLVFSYFFFFLVNI